MTSLEGFGSADVTTPFHYGSVADGIRHNPSLEQKIKKKYWKTKQTVIQKLNKSQDEFVVAGDADIDTKLEIAYHLKSSCHQLLYTLEKCCFRLRDITAQELAFGEYLGAYSEREYTNAGQVMKSTGRVLELEAKARLTVLPGLQRLYQEMATFEASALSDLTISIHTLEKARTDYRAALLWMKDVSGKLHNPDYRDQLVRFREAQAAVKEAKIRFDKLKIDLTEKIGMVNASRCNLLSRSLPTYQKAMLSFSDSAAAEFHQVLVNLRSHHHHQYKLHSDMEEIRDLESHEFSESHLFSTIERGCVSSTRQPSGPIDDDPLLDVSATTPPETGGKKKDEKEEVGKEAVEEGTLVPLSPPNEKTMMEVAKEQAGIARDVPLSGVEADLRALQNELLQEFGSSSPPRNPSLLPAHGGGGEREGERKIESGELRSAEMDLNDLLGMGLGLEGEGEDFGPLVSSEVDGGEGGGGGDGGEGKGADGLADQWNSFSSLMATTRSPVKTSLSEWEKEFSTQPSDISGTDKDPFEELDPLNLAKKEGKFNLSTSDYHPGVKELADNLSSLGLSATTPAPTTSPLVPTPAGLMAPLSPSSQGGASSSKPHPPDPPPAAPAATGKDGEKKGGGGGGTWMNVFAHLDPLSSEKA